jgi:ectoine hydroxylase-related dioxygenase (phytanoyl-CoA dioxygenase family)
MFKDPSYQDAMDRLGCCIVPLLGSESVRKLASLHSEGLSSQRREGLVANHNSTPADDALAVSKQIEETVTSGLLGMFHDFRFFVGHFMVKKAGTVDEFPLHQDWNIVHEAKYGSYQIWIPLQMTDPYNGGMLFVPGSHAVFDNYRSGSFNISRIPTDDVIAPHIERAIVPAGKAFVYSNALFHGSYPNASAHDRVSVIVNIVAKEAPTYYFHHIPEHQKAECYPMTCEELLRNLPALEQGLLPFDGSPHHVEEVVGHLDNRGLTSQALASAMAEKKERDRSSPLMFPILRSFDLEKQLVEDGFAVMPLLDANAVTELHELFPYYSADGQGTADSIHTSLMDCDGPTRRRVHQAIVDRLGSALSTIFKDHKLPLCQFFVKFPGTDNNIGLHTDSSLLLNPALEPHYGIWIPLQDVGPDNGTLTVIPGSHRWFSGVAAASVPWAFAGSMERIFPLARSLDLNAGQMVIFDNRLLHGSAPNNSGTPRVCIAGRVTHGLSSYHSFWKDDDASAEVGVYAEPDDIYLNDRWKGDRGGHTEDVFLGHVHQPDPAEIDHAISAISHSEKHS